MNAEFDFVSDDVIAEMIPENSGHKNGTFIGIFPLVFRSDNEHSIFVFFNLKRLSHQAI